MAKIRDDLLGVVYLNDGRTLKAGDEVPDDAADQVGDHLIAKARPTAKQSAKNDGSASSGS